MTDAQRRRLIDFFQGRTYQPAAFVQAHIVAHRARLAGLGSYTDASGDTWTFDASKGYYVNQDGDPNPADPVVIAQQTTHDDPATAPSTETQYGSQPNATGGQTYTAKNNPLLIQNPSGPGVNGTTYYNPDFYATAAAAAQFAAALGGTVVLDTINGAGITGTPMYAVLMPNGKIVNAGAIGEIVGNNVAYPSEAIKSAAIAQLTGADASTPLYDAVTTGTPATQLTTTQQQTTQQTAVVVNHYAPRVSLANLTTGNPAVIVAGRDRWRISITGAAPGVPVTATGSKNGGAASTSQYGNTDAAGNWAMEGTSTAADVGAWQFQYKAGSDAAGPLAFSIATATTTTTQQQTAYAPRLQFVNLTTGNTAQVIADRDQWRLSITGAAPGVPVTATGAKDGGPAAVGSYGSADAAGNWSLSGSSKAADIGAWVFTWKAGNDTAGSISFRVAASGTQNGTTTATESGGSNSGLFDGLISALPNSVGTGIKKAQSVVSAAAAEIPAAWLWAGAAGALVLWSSTKKGKR